ncbi:hypothetical protein KSS87_022691 [Heliosperma pusillum]|nr:hypothetical protein KSS87_022691 [Heliosperma pusillum]
MEKEIRKLQHSQLQESLEAQGYPTFKGQVLNGKELWDLIEGLEANNLLFYTHLLTGRMDIVPMHVFKNYSPLAFLAFPLSSSRHDSSFLVHWFSLISEYCFGSRYQATFRESWTCLCGFRTVLTLICLYSYVKVVPVASMLTPNQFEAELLTGLRIVSEQDGREACNKLHSAGPAKVVITSINIDGSLLLIGSSKKDKKYPDNLAKAAELAVSSLQALLQRTIHDYRNAGFDPKTSSLEIRLVQSQDDICNPQIKLIAEKYE